MAYESEGQRPSLWSDFAQRNSKMGKTRRQMAGLRLRGLRHCGFLFRKRLFRVRLSV